MAETIFKGENVKCKICEHIDRDASGFFCGLSCRDIKEYGPEDACVNSKDKVQ